MIRWKSDRFGCTAYANERSIGFVVERTDGTVAWQISDVVGSKYQPATKGECRSVAGAKRAFRRAWRIWLAERGLCEMPPRPTRPA